MLQNNECNNLYFLALSRNKATIYEYDVNLSKNIIDEINEEIKKNEEQNKLSNDNDTLEENKDNNKISFLNEPRSNILKKSTSKFNNDFLLNRGIRVYKEYNDVELATCTNDYKNIILVRKSSLNVAEIIEIKNDKNITYIKTKTQIKRIMTSPRDNYIVLHCLYKPDIVNTNLYVYKIGNKSNKKKKNKEKKNIEENNNEIEEYSEKGNNINENDIENKNNNNNTNDNIIYNESLVIELTLKSYSNHNWPFFKWSDSESICTCLINNQINIYKGNNLQTPFSKLKLDNIEFFELSPEFNNKKDILLATYEKGSKGNPSIFKIFNLDNLNKHIYSKSFFNSDEIKIKWNKNGTALLLQIHTQVDKEKHSYYGSSSLYFIDTVTLKEVNIMTNKGLIYDTIWSNNQNKFYVCKGEIPAEIVLHDKNGNVSHSFGRHKYNTLKLNCNEKLLLTGGFGNLSGDISIWNTVSKKEITKTKSSCAVICEFFNDGKHFLTATTNPRLRVDNNLKIYKYNGIIVSRINFEELYNVIILPFNKIKFNEKESIDFNLDNSDMQIYINKQLGIDERKTGIYRAPRSSGLLNMNGNLTSKDNKVKSSLPPGSNFVNENKSYKKKKKKKSSKNKQKRETF
ncbi:eukaryotic translation initiation factor eIF2A, putative [Plasmodium gallinaceum]|uniref:Eukaryotic translation initiation factor 2A n=1 Tax=Plasmodium gallinaceum TaxID=5849 RepID=A0A1J1GX64_PLAGA|nr:eukaryotic translation initiation factor eIF2A, putative [Plasmodium gallinaceum]CRG95885.1 eukaryotic translation initiation factor eIF2A, putative [Plasmodium gallinaceum]